MVLRQALAACSRNLCTSVPIAAERVGSTLAAQEMSRAEGACACDNPGGGPRVREGRRESVPQEYSVLSEFSPIHARTRSPLTGVGKGLTESANSSDNYVHYRADRHRHVAIDTRCNLAAVGIPSSGCDKLLYADRGQDI